MMLAFDGDCNTEAVKAQIISNFEMYSGFSEGVDFHCGASSLVNRRKRSNTRQITLRFHASKNVDVEKVKLDPTNELRSLKDDVKTDVIPNFIKNAHGHLWSSLNKGVQSMSSIRADGDVKENCGKEGSAEATIFDFRVPNSKILQKCGMI